MPGVIFSRVRGGVGAGARSVLDLKVNAPGAISRGIWG